MSDSTAAGAPGTRSDWTTVPREDTTASVRFPTPFTERYKDAQGFDPGADLIAAVNVALILGQPLLLTGAPGCGKTSVGGWLSWQLGLGDPLVHNVKSTTPGRSLLYEFDELGRFRDAQPNRSPQPDREYLRFNALGLAILLSAAPNTPSGKASVELLGSAQLPDLASRLGQRHVVLIDELDKAPRDTPNDLLFEIERMEFAVSEVRSRVIGDPARRPIVVITSNTEKMLPEPFLRRCVFHHISPPDAIDETCDRQSNPAVTAPVQPADHFLARTIPATPNKVRVVRSQTYHVSPRRPTTPHPVHGHGACSR